MSISRIGRLLLGLGVVIGGAAGVGLLAGFEPARLPPALLNVAVYKLLFAAALAILAAGAVVLRHAGRRAGLLEGRARDARPIAPTSRVPVGAPKPSARAPEP